MKKNKTVIYIIIILILGLIIFGATKVFTKKEDNSKSKEPSTTTTITTTTTSATTTSTTTTKKTTTTTTTKKTTTTTKKATTTTTTKNEEEKNEKTEKEDNGNLTGTSKKGYEITYKDGKYYVDGYLIVNKTYKLPSNYNPGSLDSKTKSAANEMFADFKAATGTKMWAQSGFRSYDTQKSIYERYVRRDGQAGADRYSARPGNSEHQSGLAFDVCVTGYSCISSGFNDTAPAKWLSENCHKYGFILRYPKGKEDETGYKYESWHFRYVGKELAEKLYNDGDWITMEDYFGITSKYAS